MRVLGNVIDSPLTALTELVTSLKNRDTIGANHRVTDPQVVEQSLQLGLDQLKPDEWAAVTPPNADLGNVLRLGHLSQGVMMWKYEITFLQKDGRWLVEKVEEF